MLVVYNVKSVPPFMFLILIALCVFKETYILIYKASSKHTDSFILETHCIFKMKFFLNPGRLFQFSIQGQRVECCPLLLGHNDICISSLYDTYSITVLANANLKAIIFLLTVFLTLQSPHPFLKTLSGGSLATVSRFDSYFWWSNAYVTSILFPYTTLNRSSTTEQRPVPNMDISYSSLLACYYYPTIPPQKTIPSPQKPNQNTTQDKL